MCNSEADCFAVSHVASNRADIDWLVEDRECNVSIWPVGWYCGWWWLSLVSWQSICYRSLLSPVIISNHLIISSQNVKHWSCILISSLPTTHPKHTFSGKHSQEYNNLPVQFCKIFTDIPLFSVFYILGALLMTMTNNANQ